MNEDKPERMPNTPPFVRFVCSAIPMTFDDSLSYYEALCALWKYVQSMTDVINHNATLEEEYIEKFNELKTYVDTYFDNLDVQEEINNKLDAMADDGTLAAIVSEYLNSVAIFGYDTVASMKAADNLIDGSYARTMGYYSKNDGGSALYKIREITNEDVVDEMFIIAMSDNNLIAQLIEDTPLKARQLGIYGDGTHDDTDKLQAALDTNKLLYLDGSYKVTDSLEVDVGYHAGIKGSSTTKILGDFSEGGFSIMKLDNSLYDDSGSGRYGTVDHFQIESIKFTDITEEYDTNATHYGNGIEFVNGCAKININQCTFNNLEHGIYFSSTSNGCYCDKFNSCDFANNDYGIYIGAVATNNNGENYRFTNCTISTSKIGNYINADMFANFVECSFDYNLGSAFILKDGSSVAVSNSHIEWYASTPLIHIEYNAKLTFDSCMFLKSSYDDGITPSYFIEGLVGEGNGAVEFNSCEFHMKRTYNALCNTGSVYITFNGCKRQEYTPTTYMSVPITFDLAESINYIYPLNYDSGLTRNTTKVKVTATTQKNGNYLILPIDYNNADAKITLTLNSSVTMDCSIDVYTGELRGEGTTYASATLNKPVSLTADTDEVVSFHYKLRKGLNQKLMLKFKLPNLTAGAKFEVKNYSIQVI